MDESNPYRDMADDELARVRGRAGALTAWSLVGIGLCFVLAIWSDWRWAPTALIPVAALLLGAVAVQGSAREIETRRRAGRWTGPDPEARSN